MKRVWAVILAAALALCLSACGGSKSASGKLPAVSPPAGGSAVLPQPPEVGGTGTEAQPGEPDPGTAAGTEHGWLLPDDEDSIRAAEALLCETDEVQYYLELGMAAQYTGEHTTVDGRECWLFVLGTAQEDQFVRERYYAVCDNLIYSYDAPDDIWQPLGAG